MINNILGTALSGMEAFKRSLETTSNNIANVNTEGYSRQNVLLQMRPESYTGSGYVGNGVETSNVIRSYDQFVTSQVRSSTSAFGEANVYHSLASQIDNIIADEKTGLSPQLSQFFGSVQDVANDPSSIPARQSLLSESKMLAQSFNTMGQRFADMRSQVNLTLQSKVTELNDFAQSVADLNTRIVAYIGRGSGNELPNDLLDERDLLVNKIAKEIDVAVVPQSDGSISVFVGQGQSLVLGSNATKFSVQPSVADPSHVDVLMGGQNVTSQLSGGEIFGILRFRDELLDPAQQQLGDLAVGIADAFNGLQTQTNIDPVTGLPVAGAYDLNQDPGTALFSTNLSADSFHAALNIAALITDPRKIAAAADATSVMGDNRVALQMARLQTDKTMLGGTASFSASYGQLVAQVGTLTHSADVSRSAQEVLLKQATASRESVAGVNLDEEAANLIKFQNAYQASAKVISVTNSLFDALMGAVR